MPEKYTLIRKETGPQGTFGSIEVSGTRFATAELPWKDNQPSISCIPAGEYLVKPYKSHKFGDCYKLADVPGRTDILFHVGNYAGDVNMGYRSDVEGCILIGEYQTHLGAQQGVTYSKKAFDEFKKLIGAVSFTVEIKDEF